MTRVIRTHSLWGKRIACLLVSCSGLLSLPTPADAQALGSCLNSDGAITVSSSSILNTYYPAPSTNTTVAAGATSIPVGSPNGAGAATPIAAGDLLLVIQMQGATINNGNTVAYGDGTTGRGATDYLEVGRYEYVRAQGPVSGGSVPVAGAGAGDGLINSYQRAAATGAAGARTYQVVRVPVATTLSVTGAGSVVAAPWNGTSGGIVALDATGDVTLTGTLNASASGFRGGGGRQLGGDGTASNTDYVRASTLNVHGVKAEGLAGTSRYLYDGTATLVIGTADGYPNGDHARGAPGNAGGGGTDGNPGSNDQNSGGGGGGNGGQGGRGGNTWSSNLDRGGLGGAAFPPRSVTRVVLGGGGGSGARNNSANIQSSGGVGGGMVFLRSRSTITGNGATAVVVADGGTGVTPANDGGGGGGAGGSAVVLAEGGLSSLTIRANGGNGTDADPSGSAHGPGGGGGGGFIVTSSTTGVTRTVAAGINGTTTAALNAYGAQPGNAGSTATAAFTDTPGIAPNTSCVYSPTAATVGDVRLSGGEFQWTTFVEHDTVGFKVERADEQGVFQPVHEGWIPAHVDATLGAHYRVPDRAVQHGETYTYQIIEQEGRGSTRHYGPYTLTLDGDDAAGTPTVLKFAGASSVARVLGDEATAPVKAQAVPAKSVSWVPDTSGALRGRATLGRIAVEEPGLYVVRTADIAAWSRFSEAVLTRALRRNVVRLRNDGRELPMQPLADGSGLVFFGDRLEHPYSDSNVYLIDRRNAAPMPSGRVQSGTPGSPSTYIDHQHLEQDIHSRNSLVTVPGDDLWFWAILATSQPSLARFDVPVSTANLADGTATAQFELFGVSAAVAHRLHVEVGGTTVGSIALDGFGRSVHRVDFDASLLAGGSVSLVIDTPAGGGQSVVMVDSVDVAVLRAAVTTNQRLVVQPVSTGVFTAAGFDSRVMVVDATDGNSPRYLGVLSPQAGQVAFEATAGRRYALATVSGLIPADLEGLTPGALTGAATADYLVVTTPPLRPAAEALASYRRGKGFNAAVVDVRDVYVGYGGGFADPNALGAYLRERIGASRGRLRHVVLFGDGHFGYAGGAPDRVNHLPPLLVGRNSGVWYSDQALLGRAGAGAVGIGRIPVRSAEEGLAYVDKLRRYEAAANGGAVLAVDNADKGGDYTADADNLAAAIDLPTTRVDLGTTTLTTARQALTDALASPVRLLGYVGHGGPDRLASEGLLTNDLFRQMNPAVSGIWLAATCYINRLEFSPFYALGADLVVRPDGGPVVVWSGTALAANSESVQLQAAILEGLKRGETLGAAASAALSSAGGEDALDSPYVVLGDPAVRLR